MAAPDFDEIIDRVGSHCAKWDSMSGIYGVAPEDGLAMWVADMDFRPPAAVQRAVEAAAAHGVYGYPNQHEPYLEATRWWMAHRHDWRIDTQWILPCAGLVNAVGIAISAFTQPGEGVIVMSPVYHAFARTIRAADRRLVELPLRIENDLYQMDLAAWDSMLTGDEKLMLLCSPHNPGGRVWSAEELGALASFCKRHGLILVSDEIHHDLVLPGSPRHQVMANVAPEIADRLVTLTAGTKTFNIAGALIGNAIIADDALRARFRKAMQAAGISANSFGLTMTAAAYSPEGADWVDALVTYLDGNRQIFDDGVNAIPGLHSMRLQATYLSWVDFSGTGMAQAEFIARVQKQARIAANHGDTFGQGGEGFLRFNIATPRARVIEAVDRLQKAFADLQ